MGDALRAAYVAVTRAKTDLHIIAPDSKFYMKSVCDKRWIQTGYGKNKKTFCKGIALFPEDVNEDSFADQEYADASQAILSCIEPGTPVDMYPNESLKCFDIYFDGQMIGRTSKVLTDALFAGFEATNHNRYWPACIRDVYITAVTTVIDTGSPNVSEQYRTSGCWLGIEIGGFPNLEWY